MQNEKATAVPAPQYVDVVVHIRKNETGEVRLYADRLSLDEDGSPRVFIWEDGNYRCDCNRRLFFARAHGETEDHDAGCSETEYSVKIMAGNECLYSEFD
jgi:hypothetical protein